MRRETEKEKIRRILGNKLHSFSISAEHVQVWTKEPLTEKEENDLYDAFPNHQKKTKRTLTQEEEQFHRTLSVRP